MKKRIKRDMYTMKQGREDVESKFLIRMRCDRCHYTLQNYIGGERFSFLYN